MAPRSIELSRVAPRRISEKDFRFFRQRSQSRVRCPWHIGGIIFRIIASRGVSSASNIVAEVVRIRLCRIDKKIVGGRAIEWAIHYTAKCFCSPDYRIADTRARVGVERRRKTQVVMFE